MSRKSYCTIPGVSVGVGVSKMLKFYVKVFYVMGKALSGELSCPCDRSCYHDSAYILGVFMRFLGYGHTMLFSHIFYSGKQVLSFLTLFAFKIYKWQH